MTHPFLHTPYQVASDEKSSEAMFLLYIYFIKVFRHIYPYRL